MGIPEVVSIVLLRRFKNLESNFGRSRSRVGKAEASGESGVSRDKLLMPRMMLEERRQMDHSQRWMVKFESIETTRVGIFTHAELLID